MKKVIIALLIFIFSISTLTSCSKEESISNTNALESTTNKEKNDNTHIDMRIQEYYDDGEYGEEIFEIPVFVSNTANCELDKLNIKISTLLDYYSGNYEGYDECDTWNIISYPISNNQYLQVVTTAISYPNNKTDGEVYSFNYDLTNNKMMSLSDAYIYDKNSRDEIKYEIEKLYNRSKSDRKSRLTKIDINGFLIQNKTVNYFVTLYENNPGNGNYNCIYTYNSTHNTLDKYIAPCLINPNDVDDDFSNLYCKRDTVRNTYFDNLHDSQSTKNYSSN